MKEYIIRLEFISPGLPGVGEGWGSIIDTDIVFDSLGLPYFPGRRLKGLLKESARQVFEMLDLSGATYFDDDLINKAFGKPGSIEGGEIIFTNLQLPDYKDVSMWCRWALTQYNTILSPDVIINAFTEIRQQTAINEKGIADDNSFRTVRVLKAGTVFEGNACIKYDNSDNDIEDLLALACINLRRLGTMRNRGFGKVKCALLYKGKDLSEQSIKRIEKGADSNVCTAL